MASSIRERAVTALVTRLKNQVKGAPSGVVSSGSGELAEYDFHWDAVVRYPLGDKEQQMHYALAVLEIDETKSEQIQTVNSECGTTTLPPMTGTVNKEISTEMAPLSPQINLAIPSMAREMP